MRALVSDEVIEERRRLGIDRRDEMWEGVLHMVPPAFSEHNEVASDLGGVLGRQAMAHGLRRFSEPGIFDPAISDMTSYRVPDLGYARPGDVSERGIEGRAVLAVEVLSPRDKSYEKLSFYKRVGVEELLYVDPRTRAFEVRRPDGHGWVLVGAEEDGWTPVVGLGVRLRSRDGRLQVLTDLGAEEV
ncbi:MAG: Uma2 family endonuclease [Acidimicrobiales bacterium]